MLQTQFHLTLFQDLLCDSKIAFVFIILIGHKMFKFIFLNDILVRIICLCLKHFILKIQFRKDMTIRM